MTDLIHYNWWKLPRINRGGVAPWGYTDSEDRTMFIPDPLMLDCLEKAKDLIAQGIPSRQVENWLTEKTGRKLSHSGLNKRIKMDNERFSEVNLEDIDEFYSVTDTKMYPMPRNGLTGIAQITRNKRIYAKASNAEEREIIRTKLKMKEAKRNLTLQKNRLKDLTKKLPEESRGNISIPEEIEQEIYAEEQEIIFKPNPGPQEDFLAATEDEVFYGGARGGGKSYALIADPLRYCGNKNFRGLFVRRTMPELRDIIYQTKQLYPRAYPGAKYKEQEHVWYFPSGARIEFGYAENEMDAERYRGQSYTWVGIDELPQYPDDKVYNLLKSSVRSTDPTLPTHMRSTGNPGNVGSGWVKRKFIDPSAPNHRFFEKAKFYDERKQEWVHTKRTLKYIPARVWDNPTLLHDESYVSALATLSEVQRKQMLEGNWDVVMDGAFPEFDRNIHVVNPFNIPGSWLKFRSADWGFSSPFCVLWMAVDWDGNIYVYREWYGQNVYDKDWAENIVKIEKEAKDYVEYGVIDGSTKSNRGENGPSIFDTINKVLRKYRTAPFKPADRSPGSRASGKQTVHQYLALKETGKTDDQGTPIKKPSLFIFSSCVNLIRTLPSLQLDPNDPEKVAKKNSEDHAYDALHYGLRSRPKTAKNKYIGMAQTSSRPPIIDEIFGY